MNKQDKRDKQKEISKGELTEGIPFLEGKNFDTALPQDWVNELKLGLEDYQKLIYGTVWLYDGVAPVFGRPFALTKEVELFFRRKGII